MTSTLIRPEWDLNHKKPSSDKTVIAWTVGILVAVVLAVGIFLVVSHQSSSTSSSSSPTSYVGQVRQGAPVESSLFSDARLRTYGQEVCNDLSDGDSVPDISGGLYTAVLNENGTNPNGSIVGAQNLTGTILAAAPYAYCPGEESTMTNGLNANGEPNMNSPLSF